MRGRLVTMKNKTALITGGTKGIGFAITKTLLAGGCRVFMCAREFSKILSELTVTQEFDYDDTKFQFIQADLKDKKGVDTFIETLGHYKDVWNIDILINNVGGGGSTFDFGVFDINVIPMIKLTDFFVRFMAGKGWGRVITIASIYGKESHDNQYFVAAKSAQIAYMKSMSRKKEYITRGITFNTVSPGHITCGYSYKKNKDTNEFKKLVKNTPMGKIGKPEDVANVVKFLCSEETSYINGANIVVDGGQSVGF